ncbi:hypothetical protein DFP81_102303 [Marinomonas pollencensis]|uniref:Uncharacterized protein n=1 Tax=Marinomonas pollencensis TaxID=491954 RepID=A0A3E0DRX3_9GAMM|nr:hypothetical protein DFP81_102303 [Marinomonas pollencensis]
MDWFRLIPPAFFVNKGSGSALHAEGNISLLLRHAQLSTSANLKAIKHCAV